jgi:hypothetical protein
MWGLTGNMDQRLVSDGRALDVAYDAGEGKPKRIAEVVIDGKYSHCAVSSLDVVGVMDVSVYRNTST